MLTREIAAPSRGWRDGNRRVCLALRGDAREYPVTPHQARHPHTTKPDTPALAAPAPWTLVARRQWPGWGLFGCGRRGAGARRAEAERRSRRVRLKPVSDSRGSYFFLELSVASC